MSELYSPKEAAAKLKVNVDTVYRYITQGLLPARRLTNPKADQRRGRHEYRITEEALAAFLTREK